MADQRVDAYLQKRDTKQCTNHRVISLLSLPGKVHAKCLKKRCREIVKPQLRDAQCEFVL